MKSLSNPNHFHHQLKFINIPKTINNSVPNQCNQILILVRQLQIVVLNWQKCHLILMDTLNSINYFDCVWGTGSPPFYSLYSGRFTLLLVIFRMPGLPCSLSISLSLPRYCFYAFISHFNFSIYFRPNLIVFSDFRQFFGVN